MRYYFIYKTVCTINNKFYIGKHSTTNLNDGYLGSGLLLRKAIDKHGRNNFTKNILEFCSKHDVDKREQYWIEKTEACRCGYNLAKGGTGGCIYPSGRLPIEHRRKIALGGLGKHRQSKNNVWREKIRRSIYNYRQQPGIIESIREKRLSNIRPNEKQIRTSSQYKYCITNIFTGKQFITTDLKDFCNQQQINWNILRNIAKGKRKNKIYQNYTAEIIYKFNRRKKR